MTKYYVFRIIENEMITSCQFVGNSIAKSSEQAENNLKYRLRKHITDNDRFKAFEEADRESITKAFTMGNGVSCCEWCINCPFFKDVCHGKKYFCADKEMCEREWKKEHEASIKSR